MSKRLLTALSCVFAALVLILALGLALRPALDRSRPQPAMPATRHEARNEAPPTAPDLQIMPLREAAGIARQRFQGRLIAARLKSPSPDERARGVRLVHELKLLTERRDVLLIRLDAQSGAFLEVAGSGLSAARRRNGDTP